ncbi:MAG: TM0106 family RecB-like putative nuclease [Acidimicrobiia bacterium]
MTTDGMVKATDRLGGAEIGRCLVRLHHDRFTEATVVAEPLRERIFARGIDYEEDVVGILLANEPAAVDLRRVPLVERERATIAAIDASAPLIVGGRIASSDGARIGMPDALVHVDDGYAPVEIKHHKVIGTSGRPALVSPLETLAEVGSTEVPFRSFRKRDLLQVAHYRSLLEDRDYASARPIGGVIGSDDPIVCLWVDFIEGDRPINTDYDAYLVAASEAITWGQEHPDSPLHEPWAHGECQRCDWVDLCTAKMVAIDDPTLLRGVGPLERTELADLGVTTGAAVASLPIDNDLVDGEVVMQARARVSGSLLRQSSGHQAMPLRSAPTEVDFDLETIGGRIYLAGLYITEGDNAHFTYLADWTGSEEGEARLVDDLFTRFARWPDDAVMYHWTEYEIRTLTEAADRHDLAIDGYETVADWFEQHAVDLCAWSRSHFVSPAGHSLKTIAPLCGFSWRDDDPGGLQSEIWFEALQAGDAGMQPRILEYNEDDVRAQAAVRDFVRAHDDGPGPGSSIPSVHDWPVAELAR